MIVGCSLLMQRTGGQKRCGGPRELVVQQEIYHLSNPWNTSLAALLSKENRGDQRRVSWKTVLCPPNIPQLLPEEDECGSSKKKMAWR